MAVLPKSWRHRTRSAERSARRILGQSRRATILSASSGKERCNAFTPHPVRSHPYIAFLVLSDKRQNSFAASAYAATSRPVFPVLALFGPDGSNWRCPFMRGYCTSQLRTQTSEFGPEEDASFGGSDASRVDVRVRDHVLDISNAMPISCRSRPFRPYRAASDFARLFRS